MLWCQRVTVTRRNDERERYIYIYILRERKKKGKGEEKMARKKRRKEGGRRSNNLGEPVQCASEWEGGREEEEKEGKGRDHGPRKAKREERRLNLTGVKLTLVGSPCIQYGDFLIESGWLLLRRSTDHRGKYLRMRASSRVKATYVTQSAG